MAKQNGIAFTCVIIQDDETKAYYGTVKGIDGVIVKGTSEDDVQAKIQRGIKAVIGAKRKLADEKRIVSGSTKFTVKKEYEQNYIPC